MKQVARKARTRVSAVVVAGALTATGCSSGSSEEPQDERAAEGEKRTVRLLVRDGNLRIEGSDCSGSGGLIFIHSDAPYRVEDGDGNELASGSLPAGTAVKALDKGFGNARRIPSNCEFAFPVTVPEAQSYQLVVDDGAPVPLKAQDNETEGPLLVGLVP
jgi:hypothetical protein